MQNSNGQFLFQFPDNIQVDMDQLYAKVVDYFNSNNQNALLSSQIQSLTTTVSNNKSSSDSQFQNVNNSITTLQSNQNNYLLINPTSLTSLNTNYNIKVIQITDLSTTLSSYLLIVPTAITPLNVNNTITTSQIKDFNDKINNYLLIIPSTTTPLNALYTITTKQITDFISFMNNYYTQQQTIDSINNTINQKLIYYQLKNPSVTTAIGQNYTITTSQIIDISTTLQPYLKISNIQSYLNNYLLTNPTASTSLNANYTITTSQITDFTTAVNALLPSVNNYLLTTPQQKISLNANYTITSSQITDLSQNVVTQDVLSGYMKKNLKTQTPLNLNYTIDKSQILNFSLNTSDISNLDFFLDQKYGTQRYNYDNQKQSIFNNQSLILKCGGGGNFPICDFSSSQTVDNKGKVWSNSYCFTGHSMYMFQGSQQISNSTNQQAQVQFNFGQGLSFGGDSYGWHYYNDAQKIRSSIGFQSSIPVLCGNPNQICMFQQSDTLNIVSYINSSGTISIFSDENKKQNILKKTNYQEQLNKLLKLDIITYSYKFDNDEKIDQLKQQFQQETDQEIKDQLKKKLIDNQIKQSKVMLGYTYQNIKECDLNYVLTDEQIINDEFIKQKNFDKNVINSEIEKNKTKTITETQFIPYLICGIKALNQNITDQDSKYQQLILDQQNQLEKINEKIDTINNAMIQSLNKIYEVSQQTDQKIQGVQQNSIINSINSDNIDDIKNFLNKLIYQFDQQQNSIKKYQTQIVFLQSQCEQMQSTIEKQQTDITSLKLKIKLTN